MADRVMMISSKSTNLKVLATTVVASLALVLSLGPLRADQHEEVIVAHGISTFGELKYDADFEHLDYVNPDAPQGGEFSTWTPRTFDSLNPYILMGQPALGLSRLYDTLMTGTLDEPDSIYGLLAETIEYPPSRQWAIFNLRPEARFSDGTPVTAEDVVFSYNILVEEGNPRYRIFFSDFESVTALDTHRVEFVFRDGADTRELPSLAATLPIFSRAFYDGTGREFGQSGLEAPLGSGPMIVHDVDPGQSITYQRREDYWARDLPIMRGQNNFDFERVEVYADYAAAFQGFTAGEYNYREEFSSVIWATEYDFPDLEAGYVVTEVLEDNRPSGAQGFFFNLRRPHLQDERLRLALGRMFNFEWSNRTLFYDLYYRTDSFWENSVLEAAGLPSAEELALLEPLREHIPETVFTEPAWVPPTSRPERLDRAALREANRLLNEAGWTLVDGRRINSEGEYLEIEILNDSPTMERIIQPWAQNLERLGIRVLAETVDPAQGQAREDSFDFDLTMQRYALPLTPGVVLLDVFGSPNANVESSANLSGIANPAVDALIEVILRAEDRESLNTAVSALDRVLRSLHIWIPAWSKGTHTIAYRDVFDRPEVKPPYGVGINTWWWNEDRAGELRAAGAL